MGFGPFKPLGWRIGNKIRIQSWVGNLCRVPLRECCHLGGPLVAGEILGSREQFLLNSTTFLNGLLHKGFVQFN